MQGETFQSELMARYAKNPEEWRPFFYTGFVSIGTALNARESVSISLNKQAFLLEEVRTEIIGADNDGLYTISMSDEISNYTNQPLPADLFHGAGRLGHYHKMPIPVFFRGNNVLSFSFQNMKARSNPPTELFQIWVTCVGWMDWGVVR
jgi:hypothetical protein